MAVALLALPFGLFFWMMPFFGPLTLGNDYQLFSIQNQMEHLFALRTGTFPLYVPGYMQGHPASVLALAEQYHPLTLLVGQMPGYWSGYALDWNTFFRLLSLGFAQLCVYGLLRRLGLVRSLAFVVALVTVYNLRMLDLFRYASALEAYTGSIYLLCAVAGAWIDPRPRRWLVAISLATYWTITSGYPQMFAFGLLGVAACTLLIPFLSTFRAARCAPIDRRSSWDYWIFVAASVGAGASLAAIFIAPFYDLLPTLAERSNLSFEEALGYLDTVTGSLANVALPLRSDVHGAFGGSPMALVALTAPLAWLRAPRPRAALMVWAGCLLVLMYMQGDRTLVFWLAYRFVPLFSMFWYPGRLSLVLPLFFLLLLVELLRGVDAPGSAPQVGAGARREGTAVLIVSLLLYLLVPLVVLLAGNVSETVNPLRIQGVTPGWEGVHHALGLAALVLLMRSYRTGGSRFGAGLMCILLCTQTGLALRFGSFVTARTGTPSFSQMLEQKQARMDYTGRAGLSTQAVYDHYLHTAFEPQPAKLFGRARVFADNVAVYHGLADVISPDEIFLEATQGPPLLSPEAEMAQQQVGLRYNSHNRWLFESVSDKESYLLFSLPYDRNWHSRVDGQETAIFRANGAEMAVHLTPGAHQVEFRYWNPAFALGLVVSLLTAIGIGWFGLSGLSSRTGRIGARLCLIALGVGAGTLWWHSIYNGSSIGTRSSVTTQQHRTPVNLAYKKRSAAPEIAELMERVFTRVVDGDTRPASGWLPLAEKRADWWQVDLARPRVVERIEIYEYPTRRPGANARPLTVQISLDQKRFLPVAEITEPPDQRPLVVVLRKPMPARFVVITSPAFLALDEVEIYGPTPETTDEQ